MCVAIQILCYRQLAGKAVSRYKNGIVTEEVGLARIRLQYKILYCDSGLGMLGAAGAGAHGRRAARARGALDRRGAAVRRGTSVSAATQQLGLRYGKGPRP